MIGVTALSPDHLQRLVFLRRLIGSYRCSVTRELDSRWTSFERCLADAADVSVDVFAPRPFGNGVKLEYGHLEAHLFFFCSVE